MSPVYLDMFVVKWIIFFNIFIVSRLSAPPWNTELTSFCRGQFLSNLPQTFFKEIKDFITNNEKEHLWMLKLGFFYVFYFW